MVIGLTPPIAIGSVPMPIAVGIQQHSPVSHVAAQNVPLYMHAFKTQTVTAKTV